MWTSGGLYCNAVITIQSGARCRLASGPVDATVSCFNKIQIDFTFLVQGHLGSPGQRAVKRVRVCVITIQPVTDIL